MWIGACWWAKTTKPHTMAVTAASNRKHISYFMNPCTANAVCGFFYTHSAYVRGKPQNNSVFGVWAYLKSGASPSRPCSAEHFQIFTATQHFTKVFKYSATPHPPFPVAKTRNRKTENFFGKIFERQGRTTYSYAFISFLSR